METTFYIVLNIRTIHGYEPFGRFTLGSERKFARSLFQKLKGSRDLNEKCMLQIDFMESANGLPANLEVLSCSLQELAENCSLITKETFRRFSME